MAKRKPLNLDGMDQRDAALALLRYMYESQEDIHERLDRLERYFAASYEILFNLHARSGAPGAPAAPSDFVQKVGRRVAGATASFVGTPAGRAAADAFFSMLVKRFQ